MKRNNLYEFISIGNLQMMDSMLYSEIPVQFKILRDITNPRTSKKYSSATTAKNIKELEKKNLIKHEILKTKTKKIIGYCLTEKGKETLNILKEAEEKYNKI